MTNRNRLKSLVIKTNDHSIWCRYKTEKNSTNNAVKQAKAKYYHNHLEKNTGNKREIWRTINNVTHRKTNRNTVTELKLIQQQQQLIHKKSQNFLTHTSVILAHV